MYLNSPVVVSFGKHSFTTVIHDVVLARLADITNPPEKRLIDNKLATPSVVTFLCDEGNKLHFVLDDIESISILTKGVTIKLPKVDVRIAKV